MLSPALFLVPQLLSLISVALAVQVFIPADTPAQCVAPCNNYKRVISACTAATPECLCTLEVEHAGFSCSRCLATKATYPQQQRELNAFIADCKLAGHPLPPMAFPAPTQLGTVAPTTARPTATRPASSSISTPDLANSGAGVATSGKTLTIPATTRRATGSSRSSASRALPTASQVIYHNSAASPRRCVNLALLIVGPLLAATLLES